MAEETITTERRTEAAPTSHTTIIREPGSSGSGMGIVIAIILLVAVIAGIYLVSRNAASDNAKNDAIAQAASDVGSAANKVGDAAQNAASKVDGQGTPAQ